MERKFRAICYSKWRFTILVLLYVFSIVPVALFFLHSGITGHIIIGIYLVIGTILAFLLLPRYVAKAMLLISADTDGFHFDWIKPYWGCKTKQTQYVRLDELKSFKYESSYNFSTLKLKLKSGSRLQFHRWYNDSNDDFDKFMTHFKRTVESYNKKKSTTAVIEKEKPILESRTFLIVIGLLIGVIFVATILLFIFKGVSNIKGIIPILIVLGPLLWVVIRIVKGLKKIKIERHNL